MALILKQIAEENREFPGGRIEKTPIYGGVEETDEFIEYIKPKHCPLFLWKLWIKINLKLPDVQYFEE